MVEFDAHQGSGRVGCRDHPRQSNTAARSGFTNPAAAQTASEERKQLALLRGAGVVEAEARRDATALSTSGGSPPKSEYAEFPPTAMPQNYPVARNLDPSRDRSAGRAQSSAGAAITT